MVVVVRMKQSGLLLCSMLDPGSAGGAQDEGWRSASAMLEPSSAEYQPDRQGSGWSGVLLGAMLDPSFAEQQG
ncbi:unnamed protein product [Gadus morhua 'NCC']